ncbi:SHOCT domain-containing protein [Curtobacterium sp. 314Chir4.1]|uniref:SHOCT domain-containing protein n=1 Tax=Curtobacterium sp. 314Chir4.1 TaxID=1279028 RepID=UPI000BE45EA5|nr:SHOCT domain-containing protein [Curtobacterium sp. 314Chir4.1]
MTELVQDGVDVPPALTCGEDLLTVERLFMAIARTIDWRLLVTPDEADQLLRTAFTKLGLDPTGAPGEISGASKTQWLKNRWAATVTASVRPHPVGSTVALRVEMSAGTKHYAVATDIANELGDDVFDDRGLSAVLNRLSRSSKFFGAMELKNIRHYLTATETVVEIGQGTWGRNQGIIVLTDERLFFFDKAMVGATIEEFPLTAITSVAVQKRLGGEALAITVSGNLSTIGGMMHGQGDSIARAFRDVKANLAPAGGQTTILQPHSDADELEKLAALRDRGILTDAEFDAKKADILNRM